MIVAQTEHQRTLLSQHYGREVHDVISNFHPEPVEQIDKSGPFQIAWVANIKEVKQPERFVDLAAALSDTEAQFLMVGELKRDEKRWGDLAKRMDAMPNISYTGSVSQERVNEILGVSHLLVNTSVYEGFSNTFIQAWLREAPVYSLAVKPDGLLSDPSVGFCAENDFDSLVESVRQLITKPERRSEIGLSSKTMAQEKFGMGNAARLAALL